MSFVSSPWLWESLGALPDAHGVRFTVWAPLARAVSVVLEAASGVSSEPISLEPASDGLYTRHVPGLGAGTRYRVMVDGRGPFPDPASRFQPHGVHGSSEVIDPASFAWSDRAWRGRPLEQLVLYELHVGAFTPEGTFAAAIDKLPHVAALGVTAIEIMPLADFPGERNWGYDGAALWAPARHYGRPGDFRQLVDAAHAHGLAVHLDVVYNHLGPDGAYVVAVAPPILARGNRTRWGTGLNLDGEHSAGVREFLIRNAIHWVREYHLDGLRLDATPALVDSSPRHFVAELGARVRAAVTGRPVVTIAEDVRNLSAVVAPESSGGWEMDGVWSFDFHHQIHRLLTGQCDGYYTDFADAIEDLATIAQQGWLFAGQHSKYTGGMRGDDPAGIDLARFVFYLQNHDEIGNRPLGERLSHLIEPAAHRAATALLLLLPQTPLLFMGDEWATSAPFRFFTDHDEKLGVRVAAGRRRDFGRFETYASLDPPHPQHPDTFAASRLRWDEITQPHHAATLAFHRALLALRQSDPALRAGTALHIEALDHATLLVRRDARDGAGDEPGNVSGTTLVAVIRLRDAGRVELAGVPALGDLAGSQWVVALHTEQSEFATSPRPMVIDPGRAIIFARPGAVVFGVTRRGRAPAPESYARVATSAPDLRTPPSRTGRPLQIPFPTSHQGRSGASRRRLDPMSSSERSTALPGPVR